MHNNREIQNGAAESGGGPLRGRFPGELALRDLTGGESPLQAGLVTARFAMLQLVERMVVGGIEPHLQAAEVASAMEYITPLRRRAPADALRLQRLAERILNHDARAIVTALLSVGDSALARMHPHGAFGFYRIAHQFASELSWPAATLSAADRLASVARELGRNREATKWERRRRRLVTRCH